MESQMTCEKCGNTGHLGKSCPFTQEDKNSMSEDSNKLARSHDRGVLLLPDLAKEIEPKLEYNSSSIRTQIDLKPKSTRIGTLIARPVYGLRNSSSVYK